MSQPLLTIDRLTVEFPSSGGSITPITDVSFQIDRGETVCLVGESGSGKTITSKAIMRLIEFDKGRIATGSVKLDGEELTTLPQSVLRAIRGKRVSMIFQEPMAAFDPVFTIGTQLVETIRRHDKRSNKEAREQAVELLRRVGFPEPKLRMNQYPNEMSGGMLQRAMIAMALACGPELLIADEPTTALDVTIQAQILRLLNDLKAELGMSILLITHDLGIAAEIADRMIVMYAGRIVEQAPAARLFAQPRHPYAAGLLRSITTMDSDRNAPLYTIEGTPPNVADFPSGCRFHPRCPLATEQCRTEVPPLRGSDGHEAACWHTEVLVSAMALGQPVTSPAAMNIAIEHINQLEPEQDRLSKAKLLFEVRGLTKHYAVKGAFGLTKAVIHAVDDVSFSIREGETFGLVGESGSGKSTLGRVLIQLEKATAGQVFFGGEELTAMDTSRRRAVRRDMQMIFQDPYGSVNPRWTVGETIAEPLAVHEALSPAEQKAKVEELLHIVGLNPQWASRYPHEFSGGQRQRIGIARAIALNPRFVLADEAVSALDVSVQAQIVNLMQELQNRLGLTYVFIAHGLNIVRHVSSRIGVMYLGNLVEVAQADELFRHPAHPYTAALIASIPWPDPTRKKEFAAIQGEIPSPASPPSGCRFHTRCPAVTARCREQTPKLVEITNGHSVACHYPL
ncbi:ABC transporter ATP-binding protein [Paenibacillus sp. FSL H7-0331]|uniref:ABC transporter ATP-binding protein n=1 Tax=Paenibacillus sp. FSL H7-0331 TaxID=1920421 RepID=UPI00096D0D5E|nr:ABC transporter ATP-binding protein [Paenibacillus sp. FSL H7-0331]OMF14151.1 glutathione ABC transporter ATP-binding protein [Paenibacillus sp. FSL H7-0331]